MTQTMNGYGDDDPPHVVLRPEGDLDANTSQALRESWDTAAGAERLVVVLNAVPFVDSAGLGAVIAGLRSSRERNQQVVVVTEKPPLRRLLTTTGLDRTVHVTESYESALKFLREQS